MPGTNTQTLTGIFGDIADEIRAKDGSSATITPANMATAIANIPSGGGGFDVTGLSGVKFYYNTDTSIDLSTLDTSGFTDMRAMFSNCSNLTSIDISGFDVSNVTNMYSFFSGCSNLSSITVGQFNTSHVSDLGFFLSSCPQFVTGNFVVPSWIDLSSATNCRSMFSSGHATAIDASNLDTSRVENMSSMFASNLSMTSINLQSFTTQNCTSMNNIIRLNNTYPSGSLSVIWAINSTTVQPIPSQEALKTGDNAYPYVYVRTSLVNAYKSATNWSAYASYIKPISELPAALQTLYNIDPQDYQ